MVSDRGFLATQDQNDGCRLCLGSVGAGGLSGGTKAHNTGELGSKQQRNFRLPARSLERLGRRSETGIVR